MSDPLDTAWRILKEPVVGSEHQSSLTPGSGAVVGPGGQIFFGDQYQVAMGGNRRKPQNRTESWGSRHGRSVAEKVQAGGEGGAMFQPQTLHIQNPKGKLGEGWNALQWKVGATPTSLAGLAARGIGHAADVGSMVASLPFAALGFNEGQQSGSFGGAMDATLAGYGKGRALTNLGSRVMHGMADNIQDSQRGYDQSMAEHEKAQQEAAAAAEAGQNTQLMSYLMSQYGPMTGYGTQGGGMLPMTTDSTHINASHGQDDKSQAHTQSMLESHHGEVIDVTQNPDDGVIREQDPMSSLTGGIAPGNTLGGDPVKPQEFETMFTDDKFFERSEPMDLAWRMLKGV